MRINSLMIFVLLGVFLIALLQVHIFEIAFAKLGISPQLSLFLLIASLFGSGINLPLFVMDVKESGHLIAEPGRKPFWEIYRPARPGKIVVAVNVGGCLIPVALSFYFISLQLVDPFNLLVALLGVTALSYHFSRLMPGLGVGMPILLAPFASALLALLLEAPHAAHLAYISGVLGVLLGADLLKLKQVTGLGAPIAAIGGAGTFDGIFLTGIIAALLA
ncbi:MAG: hypothetical protein CTY34_10595 [Methylobacter sp.]|nr:MAG: hypothetical protein CTY34_10595 [Methylobacter sp.]PPD03440.1 MAG: hypothetical protein CTY29_09640 [Methylobacter sp.]PPD23844.1 MAG: hypothetical protein CTY24_03030 [Methylobacter sp.]PPD34617.1 MAG: hypothetical protein CTY18_07840 [Methylomonas sp.]